MLTGRFVGRLVGGGSRTHRACGYRHGYRWLDSSTGCADRHCGHQADVWPGFALRHDRVRLQSRSGRCDYAFRRRCCPFTGGNGGSLGANTVEVDLPNLDLSVPTYYVVAPAECSSNLSRFDGVRFGHRAENAVDLLDLYCRSRGEGFGDEVKRRIMTGTYVLSAGYYDAYYLKAQKVRQLIADDFKNAFADVDVIAGPTTPTPAFKLGEKVDDPILMYLNDIYTIGANLAGLPAMSVPCGFVDDLPVGLHLVGAHFAEATLLRCAHQYQQQTDWHTACPAAFR